MKKVAVFAFSGDPALFAHAMLNVMDMKDRGYDVKMVVEGDATKMLSLLRNETKPLPTCTGSSATAASSTACAGLAPRRTAWCRR